MNDNKSFNSTAILASGQQTIFAEADALNQLGHRLGSDFVEAAELVLNCQGRVIVMGIGKSGHIGRKIAATLASTGSPSFFVHSAEALHGDLGMVTGKDIRSLSLFHTQGKARSSRLPCLLLKD